MHPGQQRQWFEGQNTEQLASSISAFFANKLRSVKTSVAAGLASAIGGVDVCPPPQLPISTMSSFDPVDPIEVERIINQLQPKTSPLDIVPVSVMKLCKAELSVVIANLANLSFTSGKYEDWLSYTAVEEGRSRCHRLQKFPTDYQPAYNFKTVGTVGA